MKTLRRIGPKSQTGSFKRKSQLTKSVNNQFLDGRRSNWETDARLESEGNGHFLEWVGAKRGGKIEEEEKKSKKLIPSCKKENQVSSLKAELRRAVGNGNLAS